MEFKYVCGCKQVTLFSDMIHDRDCPQCNLPANPKKMKPLSKSYQVSKLLKELDSEQT